MIRQFETEDINQLVDLLEENGKDVMAEGYAEFDTQRIITMVKSFHNQPNRDLLLAWHGSQLVGHAIISAHRKVWGNDMLGEIHLFFIRPGHRKGFIAKDLWQGCYDWFRKRNCVCMMANVQAWDKDYVPCTDWIESGERFYNSLMTPVGSCYVKEIV